MGTGLATSLAIGVGYLASLIMNVVISMFKNDKKDKSAQARSDIDNIRLACMRKPKT
jgi:hypothetical protein